MEFDSKKKFRGDNISLFREVVLDSWKSRKTIDEVSSIENLEQLRNYVRRCLQEDKQEVIKNHPEFPLFLSWIREVSKQNQAVKDEKGVVNKLVDIAKSEGKKPAEVTKESTPAGEAERHEAPVVSLQKAIDLFEQRIVERDTEIKELKKQIDGLKDRIQKDRQAAINEKDQLHYEMERKKQEFAEKSKEFQSAINSLQETLKQKNQIIGTQNEQLNERKNLLEDNDIRFENHYKQQMMALGNKLKSSFSDLEGSINDLTDNDDKQFLEVPFQEIVQILKKEGVEI